jgi:TonB family protein
MPVTPDRRKATFGLLPEPERSPGSFITSIVVNGLILAFMLYLGATARQVIDQHKYEETLLILPAKKIPPEPKHKVTPPPPPKDLPRPVEMKFEAPKINVPRPEPKPEKPIQMDVKLALPVTKEAKPDVILAPQPKSALTAAAMPAQDNKVKPSTAPVHLGQTFGVTPNPNAKGPATIAAIGNEYGNMRGPAIAPHGVPGSTGIGDGTKFGNNNGRPGGRVASVAVPKVASSAPAANVGRVAAAGISTAPTAVAVAPRPTAVVAATNLEVLSKPQPEYTNEAKQLKVQGDVILRVTFTASGRVLVQGVVHGLGHGLDEEARRVAQQIRFRPATRNGQAVDMTTNITITFQLA